MNESSNPMNWIVLIALAAFGYWIVSKLIPSKDKPESDSAPTGNTSLRRPWFEVLEISKYASDREIEARYQELMACYTDEAIAALEPELQEDAKRGRNEIEAAYHFSQFRKRN